MIGSSIGTAIGEQGVSNTLSAASIAGTATTNPVAITVIEASASVAGTSATNPVAINVFHSTGAFAGSATLSSPVNTVIVSPVTIAGAATTNVLQNKVLLTRGSVTGTSAMLGGGDYESRVYTSTQILHKPIDFVMAEEAGHGPRRGLPAELMRHVFNE